MEKITRLQRLWAQCRAYPYTIDGLIFLIMVALAIFIYFPSIKAPFIFDDVSNILHSPAVRMTEFSFIALKKVVFEAQVPTRPVANISFALNYLVGQYDVTGYHAVNIFLHAATSFLLYLFFRVTLQISDKFEEKKFSAVLPFVAAFIWLVHPMQSQSVAYIIQRMTSLSATFYLLSMLLYAHGRLAYQKRNRVMFLAGSTMAALLALGSKENAATLPLFIFLYEWYFFQNLKWGWLNKRLLYVIVVVGFFLSIALVFLGTNPIGRIISGYEGRGFTLYQRVLTELRVVLFYMGQLLFPHPDKLSLEHDFTLSHSIFSPMTTLFSAAFLVGIIALAIWLAKRERIVSFAILWYLGNLLIESSVIGLEIIFEHRNYLPSMFFVLLVVVLGERFIKLNGPKLLLTCIVIAFFAFWTYERSLVWADDEILIRDCIKKAPNKSRMYNNLGTVLFKKSKFDEAISAYHQALQNFPYDPNAEKLYRLYSNLGNCFSMKGQYAEADNAYYQALRINPAHERAYLGLGNNSMFQGNYNEAVVYYRKVLSITQEPAVIFKARSALVISLKKLGRFQEALNY